MIAEYGHIALILALCLALVQGILPLIGAARGIDSWIALAPQAALGQAVLVAFAFGCLTYAYVTSDFSVLNVAENSHTLKPMLYKISGVWGNHEGSLLLWILILVIFGAAVAVFGGNLPATLKARVLAIQGLIGVGFLAFILFTSNPFGRLLPPPLEGRGLNPLLQDPGLAFHPPFLYLGYVGFSVAFSFAVAALIEGRVDPAWARWVRPWTLAAWCFLTLGIALGSWWAYYELGWGGWWFWDPVENASFMPWLAGTALLHSAIVVEKRDTLKSWTILLAILTFSLSLLGTFLVRSGVINSVHAFATDPTRGVFILAFLGVVVGGSLALYALRAPALQAVGVFAPISREGALVLNNLLLAVASAAVLLGTLYPVALDAISGAKVSVGPQYFNAVFMPLMAPLVAAIAVGPMLAWKRGDLATALQRLVPAAVAMLIALGLGLWLMDAKNFYSLLGLGLGAWLGIGALCEVALRVKLFAAPLSETLNRARFLPRAAWGMTVAHLGVAMLVLGITVSETWQIEVQQVMKPGEVAKVGPVEYRFLGVQPIKGPNYTAQQGRFEVLENGRVVREMRPAQRRYQQPPMETTEAAIRPSPVADLYAVVGEGNAETGWAVRLYWKPLVSWIWLGALVMAFGGVLSLSDRRHRVGAPVRRRQAAPSAAE
ncbi:heme lyase CcmF/NrfE family subunit [Ferrovibrio sp.]|jgi:cytochrome c-type biogenesis protein CcmF|uniref:heme lyase CcmF/NrfE family subunit n=1 Tax=Ferrovibrio sp. TaxID=1917215 RepID=UPI0035AF73AA